MNSYYPKSRVEIKGLIAKHYDKLIDTITFGKYRWFIEKTINLMKIKPADRILDLGAGTGRNACLIMKYLSQKGELIGLDISKEMITQFKKKCNSFPNASIINQRIDQPLAYSNEFDKVFICFVLHGFPQSVRETIIENAFKALKRNGDFFILDYNEFSLRDAPSYLRLFFKLIECPYAFDFIRQNWKKILSRKGFNSFEEHFFFRGYVRLLKGTKFNKAH